MNPQQLSGASVNPQANVYFDGKCISHSLSWPDGSKKSVGVILPATLTFNTAAAEIMECVAGACEWRPSGSEAWQPCGPGQQFSIAANASFEIRVSDTFHYICHFG
ncbi:pyrimidine/purine nucleoside phosphorylase [Melaminivora jejuensis]|uniref:pyrimidine/purine nucleoside phosphorylase n=1 Tax=Melaminivora jejuensis TaxID=1267217 RepID=UPI001ADFC74E|nr:pyrimidine/purine nucleoside phosphorylase [Melaminivora jejuensis]UHJ63685.1 pyrimidine/purine nucleoside phosphorylase [Melaminivora jejuensis]